MAAWRFLRILATLGFAVSAAVAARAAEEGRFVDGARWRMQVPEHWNGTLLLYSHGYSADVTPPELAPRGLQDWLLGHGYALAASSYSRGGWAVAEAVPDQRLVLATFAARSGRPRLTIAWGDSMVGLVTTALVETPGVPIDGGLSACGSIAGTLAMMNTALDGAFAFVTLQAPAAGIRIVAVDDDRANAARVAEAVSRALGSPEGRARVALAGVLGGLPVWTDPAAPQPPAGDYDAQLDQMAKAVAGGLFPPRTDQEHRAGGVSSWNTGVDYRAELARTGRRRWVQHFYTAAHLNLRADLERLNAAPRIAAQASATAYLRQNYAPTARPLVPFLSMHTRGDGLTTEVLQTGYARAVLRGPESGNYRAVSVDGAGHCRFTPAEYVAALRTLELRLGQGHWSADPATLNARAAASGLGAGRFVRHRSAPLLRPCWGTELRCAGEPPSR